MRLLKLLTQKTVEMTLLVLLLLAGSVINAEKAGMLQQGEDVIVLDVESMT